MKPIIISAEKKMLPQFNAEAGTDVLTLMIETTVEFHNDDGTLHHTQTYAQRPSEIDADNPLAYFERQAAVLQADADGKKANAETEAHSELADKIIEKLTHA